MQMLITYEYIAAYLSGTSIRRLNEAKARLHLHKRPDESYNDMIPRLTTDDKP